METEDESTPSDVKNLLTLRLEMIREAQRQQEALNKASSQAFLKETQPPATFATIEDARAKDKEQDERAMKAMREMFEKVAVRQAFNIPEDLKLSAWEDTDSVKANESSYPEDQKVNEVFDLDEEDQTLSPPNRNGRQYTVAAMKKAMEDYARLDVAWTVKAAKDAKEAKRNEMAQLQEEGAESIAASKERVVHAQTKNLIERIRMHLVNTLQAKVRSLLEGSKLTKIDAKHLRDFPVPFWMNQDDGGREHELSSVSVRMFSYKTTGSGLVREKELMYQSVDLEDLERMVDFLLTYEAEVRKSLAKESSLWQGDAVPFNKSRIS